MQASAQTPVMDPYDWLPSYGETKVSFRYESSTLDTEIFYDHEADDRTETRKKVLRFSGVCAFFVAASPGVEITCINYTGRAASGELVEYLQSDGACLWRDHLKTKSQIRHFQMFFMSANKRLEVFAEDWQLLEQPFAPVS